MCAVFRHKKAVYKQNWSNSTGELDIEKPEQKLFGDFYLRCPQSAENYLVNTYGENWCNIGATPIFCHITRETKSSIEFDIISNEPAKPFK